MPRIVARRKTRGRVSPKVIRKANRQRKATGLEKQVHALLKAMSGAGWLMATSRSVDLVEPVIL